VKLKSGEFVDDVIRRQPGYKSLPTTTESTAVGQRSGVEEAEEAEVTEWQLSSEEEGGCAGEVGSCGAEALRLRSRVWGQGTIGEERGGKGATWIWVVLVKRRRLPQTDGR
jgi:hypothetical protein